MESLAISGGINPLTISGSGVSEAEYSTITPLEQVVGFATAEETYDRLTLREQVIVDLLAAGYKQAQIGMLFSVSQPSISSSVRRIRFKLADSQLRTVLDLREDYRGN